MSNEKVDELVVKAKYLYDHGVFNTIAQGEFFKAIREALDEVDSVVPVGHDKFSVKEGARK